MSEPVWDRAFLPATLDRAGRPETLSLRPGVPDVATLFAFMRDAELRFRSLRLRIEEVAGTTAGYRLATIDVSLRHAGRARVTRRTTGESGGVYDSWVSDGTTVWTYSGASRVTTERPVRRPPDGMNAAGLPGRARVYVPLTPLPRETLPDTFVHPAGLCQNVLATGRVWVAGTAHVEGRAGFAIECDHPRSVLVAADRQDHQLSVVADAETGVILRLVETIGGSVTRDARVTSLEVDAELPDSLFRFEAPADARSVY